MMEWVIVERQADPTNVGTVVVGVFPVRFQHEHSALRLAAQMNEQYAQPAVQFKLDGSPLVLRHTAHAIDQERLNDWAASRPATV